MFENWAVLAPEFELFTLWTGTFVGQTYWHSGVAALLTNKVSRPRNHNLELVSFGTVRTAHGIHRRFASGFFCFFRS